MDWRGATRQILIQVFMRSDFTGKFPLLLESTARATIGAIRGARK
jgi:hypothetical protein